MPNREAFRRPGQPEEVELVHSSHAAEVTCPIALSLDEIGDRWSLLIIRDALGGDRRFSEFQRNLGVGRNVLSARLSKLVSIGVLRMQPASDGSAYREYVLTEKGKSLRTVMRALYQWGEDFLIDSTCELPSRAAGRMFGRAYAPSGAAASELTSQT